MGMKKRILALVSAMVLLGSTPVWAEIDYEIDVNQHITIRGMSGRLGEQLPLVVVGPDGQIVEISQVTSGADGAFTHDYTIGADAKQGEYRVMVGGELAGTFTYHDPDTVIAAFNDAEVETVEEIIRTYGYAVGVALTGDYARLKDTLSVKEAIAAGGFSEVAHIKNRFDEAVAEQLTSEQTAALAAVNAAALADMPDLLTENHLTLRLDENTYYAGLSDKSYVYERLVGKNFADVEALRAEVDKAAAVQAVYESTEATIADVLTDNAAFLGIDLAAYYTGLENPSVVHNALMGERLADEEAVAKTFREMCVVEAMNEAKPDEIQAIFDKEAVGLGLDLTGAYADLSDVDQQAVVAGLCGNNFQSVGDVVERFRALVEELDDSQQTGAQRPSSSTGGSSSWSGGSGSTSVDNDYYDQVTGDQTGPSAPQSFTDMDTAAWAAEAVSYLHGKGIVNGKTETEFAPNDAITREEFLAILVRAFSLSDAEATCDFSDVASDAWYYEAVASGASAGIVTGDGTGAFGVGAPITRQDMAVMVYRTAAVRGQEIAGDAQVSFTDEAEIASYAQEAVSALTSAGILNGVGEGRFAPSDTATRAMAAKMIYELMVQAG